LGFVLKSFDDMTMVELMGAYTYCLMNGLHYNQDPAGAPEQREPVHKGQMSAMDQRSRPWPQILTAQKPHSFIIKDNRVTRAVMRTITPVCRRKQHEIVDILIETKATNSQSHVGPPNGEVHLLEKFGKLAKLIKLIG
jgi:hypothetical protein